jgi:phenylpropionate dioxygenase-like ring-hydroxylating dioxygenase large terminal subunit
MEIVSQATPVNLTARYPELDNGPVRADVYWQPEIFDQEIERIFRPTWHCVGREEQITATGEFFVKELPTFEFSVIVARGDDGAVRAFLNACPHRGNQVELTACGRRSAFTCKFHAWSYDLKGRLKSVPDEAGFPGLDKAAIGLTEFPCETWQGFVFVNLNENPPVSLIDYLGEQGADLEGYPFDQGTARFQFAGEVETNWKFLVDSFCETYHVPFLHRRTIHSTMAGPDNPHGRVVDVRLKGDHRTTSVWGNRAYEPKTVQAMALTHTPGVSITSAGADTVQLPRGLNQTRSPNWSIDVTVFFPGFVCVIGAGMYFTHQMWPLAANRTRWEMTGYLRTPWWSFATRCWRMPTPLNECSATWRRGSSGPSTFTITSCRCAISTTRCAGIWESTHDRRTATAAGGLQRPRALLREVVPARLRLPESGANRRPDG